MKNVTLSADEDLIERSRLVARSQRRTLNAAFREWLLQFTAQAAMGRRSMPSCGGFGMSTPAALSAGMK
jgi:hypothetical protein